MSYKFYPLVAALFFIFSITISAQLSETERSWNEPVEPFKIVGNIYYVGASDVTSYLITTPKGHILLDSGFLETVPLIKANLTKLGFKLEDVKVLINSHAHYDHAGGIAELQRITKGKLYASEADSKLLARGGKKDPNFGDKYPFEPVTADRTFRDGWKLKHGGITLKANITSGHTKGCTTWATTVKDGGRNLNVVFVCSTSAPGYTLVGNAGYPDIAADYESTFKRMKAFRVDVFLSSHANAFDMETKVEAMKSGPQTNPFIDPAGYLTYLNEAESAFLKLLASQNQK